ncbi:Transposase and inactivated derivative [alpha proteobacterium BAL199]|nr:Transposase and inactivated derivative [alpha proteobacterium BAL199]
MSEQCHLLSIPHSTFYYTPKGETPLNLALMRRIDKQFPETPFYGVRQMTWHLRAEGHPVNEKRVRRLMRLMGLMPIYQGPKTSVRAKEHRVWPYLLRGLKIVRANHVPLSAMRASPAGQRERRRDLCADAARVPLSGCHRGLGNPQGPGVAIVQPARHRTMCRRAHRDNRPVRPAPDHEHRPG